MVGVVCCGSCGVAIRSALRPQRRPYWRQSLAAVVCGVACCRTARCLPVENALASPKKLTALMSDSCPLKVRQLPGSLMSHTLARASHAPETKTRPLSGIGAIDMTSPLWSSKVLVCWPVSTSHSMQVISPEEVRMVLPFWPRKRQHER